MGHSGDNLRVDGTGDDGCVHNFLGDVISDHIVEDRAETGNACGNDEACGLYLCITLVRQLQKRKRHITTTPWPACPYSGSPLIISEATHQNSIPLIPFSLCALVLFGVGARSGMIEGRGEGEYYCVRVSVGLCVSVRMIARLAFEDT